MNLRYELRMLLLMVVLMGAFFAIGRCTAPEQHIPDPSVCVQLAWLDGAWQCITTEQAG